jgi:hypothetical protein
MIKHFVGKQRTFTQKASVRSSRARPRRPVEARWKLAEQCSELMGIRQRIDAPLEHLDVFLLHLSLVCEILKELQAELDYPTYVNTLACEENHPRVRGKSRLVPRHTGHAPGSARAVRCALRQRGTCGCRKVDTVRIRAWRFGFPSRARLFTFVQSCVPILVDIRFRRSNDENLDASPA